MATNHFGNIFKMTTWGESHGKAIGVVIDGCPAGLEIDESDINAALALRAPGRNPYTSPRKETDEAEILSGVFEGKTTGAPISILIPNKDVDSSKYEPIKDLLRPGHANYTYLEKYGIFDYRGGGRASARETACRVAAGAVAKKFLHYYGIHLIAYIKQIGNILATPNLEDIFLLRNSTYQSSLFCPDANANSAMIDLIEKAKSEGDSLGGVVEFFVKGAPVGLGEPVYEKLESILAQGLMSLPATKGFEIGSGFRSVGMRGSEHNDIFSKKSGKISTETNFAGGTLGGISTGMPIIGRVAFKPTSSIMQSQKTLNTCGETSSIELPTGSRHDPCVAIRAVPVVEAMVALAFADAMLMNRSARL
ncbi:MAG: chorismate synthase [Parachlamydiaceae bacterium]|nr:chorismate synthase [Parachlamydiaceae bacterium]